MEKPIADVDQRVLVDIGVPHSVSPAGVVIQRVVVYISLVLRHLLGVVKAQ